MRKTIVLVLLFCLGTFGARAQSSVSKVKWYSIAEAVALQKKVPRKIVMDIYTDWCGWCKRMDTETFDHPVIAEYINTHYYAVKFNAETSDTIVIGNQKFINPGHGTRSTHQLAMALFQAQQVQPAYPSLAFFTENMQLIFVRQGYSDPTQMELLLNYVIAEKYKPTPLEEYQKTFVSRVKISEEKK